MKQVKLTSLVKRELKESVSMKCQNCGKHFKYLYQLTVHHIDGNNMHNEYGNYAILCRHCHDMQHPKGVTTITERRTRGWIKSVWDEDWLKVAINEMNHAERREFENALLDRLREAHSDEGIRIHKKCAICEKYWNRKDLCNLCFLYRSGICERFVAAVMDGRGKEWIMMVLEMLK